MAKLRLNPNVVHGIHEVVGVPLRWLLGLTTLEFAGAVGLLIDLFGKVKPKKVIS